AWVRFPELTLQPLPQEYLRVSDRQYRYSSRNGAFTAGLTVDEVGLVMDYEGFWRRVDERK
ncbi:MAG TPA: putative glycolipid-binding domain-containing protein, partial [Candidatus Angelobacter sp.]|nr:putative glycolipid-binding domain-containing protein [Candidatus Angelobacter sp.]